MKTYYILLVLGLGLFMSCEDSESASDEFSVDGKTYIISSYVLSEGVDSDGDGVYSFDIFNEQNICGVYNYFISFLEGEKIYHPGWAGYSIKVEENEDGDLTQVITCGFLDGILPTWEQNQNTINVFDGLTNDLILTGNISGDGQSISFDVPFEMTSLTIGDFNQILAESGNIIEYADNVKITYTLDQ